MSENASNHNDQRSIFLTRQVVEIDDNWTMKPFRNGNQFIRSTNQGEATLLETERDEHQMVSPDRSISDNMVDNEQHSFSSDDLDIDDQSVHSSPKPSNTQPSSSPTQTKTNVIPSIIHSSTLPTTIKTRRPISRIPIRSHSSTQSRSRSPTLKINKQQISSPTNNKGAFHYFTTNDHKTENPSKRLSLSKDNRQRITSSDDDDDDIETNNLKENDLKLKLKEEKRHGKQTGELLNKLHENYEELLEKYAQAENTIDQLRFQPKIFGDNTPTSTTSGHVVHVIHQSKANISTLRSSGAYHSTNGSPLSSIRPVPSTTTTTPARKSISPANSGTIESVFFDEVIPEKPFVQQLTTSETLKLDLLIQTKTLGDKMKTFLTLMDTNQLSLAEQKQVYESIKQDYEKLSEIFDQNIADIDIDEDLNKELETMKQLLSQIVKRITQNLLGKSANNSLSERQTHDGSQSSQLSVRSSLCNHNDLMDQYQKLLNAVNTNRKDHMVSVINEQETDSRQLKSDLSDYQQPTNHKQKAYTYVSGDSDEEEEQSDGVTPIPYTKGRESTSFELDYIPSASVKHHQHKIEEQTHNNLENMTKSNRKIKTEQKKTPTPSSSLIPTNRTRYSNSSTRTRANDYDSGIGTNNLTKLSYDSKLYTNTMDESHFQSLDDEQESISSSSSSRSSGSGSASPGSPYRFDNRSSYRRKPSGHSSKSYRSDIETYITGSFDPLPQYSSNKKTMHRSNHTWKPTSVSQRSRLTPVHRSASIENYRMKPVRPSITAKINTNQNVYHQPKIPSTYRSSVYINQTHTHKKLEEKPKPTSLYVDPQTGIVYLCESNKIQNPIRSYHKPSSQTKLYRCEECGSVTTYHHRHHIDSTLRRLTTHLDDLGYESGYKKKHRKYRYLSSSSDSDSDSDVSSSYLEMIALNQAYNRAEKIQSHSRCLSRYIVRQLKLALAATL